jgi:hypothetical protein
VVKENRGRFTTSLDLGRIIRFGVGRPQEILKKEKKQIEYCNIAYKMLFEAYFLSRSLLLYHSY